MGVQRTVSERTVSLGTVWAISAWVAAVLLMLSGTIAAFTAETYGPAFALLSHGLLMTGIAATLTIRVFFAEHRRMMVDAYQLGRQQASGAVRRISP